MGALLFFVGYVIKEISGDGSYYAGWGERMTIPGAIVVILSLILLLVNGIQEEKK